MKKILISIVSAVTLMLLFVLCANAAVAKVDGQEYDTLSDALTAAQDGGTVVLLSDAVIDETISIEKSITIDGKGFKLIPADTEKTYASAIMAGNSGWGESDGSVKISLENVDISGWTVNYGVIRAQGVDLTVDGCTFSNNTVLLYAYAVVSSNYSKSLIKNSKFESNSGKAIDVNYNIETSTTPVTVEGCTFNNNETTQPGIVMRSRGQIFVRNCVFTNNEISTSGNAATLYVGFGTGSEVTGCYFANNSVVTNKTADTRIGSAIFCDGTTVTGNVFAEGNALTYAGGALPYVVSIGAYYGQPNISGNYWQGHEPKLNTDYRVEFANYEVLVDNYYNSYKVENGVYTVYNREIVYVAQVGNAKYETLAEAVEAAKNGGTVVLLSNVDLGTTTLEIPAGYDIVLDLNGKVISGRTGSSNEKALIRVNNEATLTVVDGAEGGKITMAKGGSAEGFTIDVKGNLILNSGTIELTGAWSIGFAVDVRPNAWGTAYKEKTTFVMNGGKIVSSDGGVRVDSNSSNDYEALGVYFTMNGGEIVADWDAIMYQHRFRNKLYVEINDGTLSGYFSPIRVYSYDGAVVSNVYLRINGGTFNYTGPQRNGWIVENVILSSHESVANAAEITVAGGTFEGDVTPYCQDGYIAKNNGDGTYTVVKDNFVAEVGGVKYESLQDAITAAGEGETVTLLKDVTLSAALEINKSIKFDGNGKALKSSAARAINVTGANGVTIENITIVCSGERAINIIKNSTNVVINKVNATAANYAVCVTTSAPNAAVTVNNSTLKGLNVVSIAGAGSQITVEDCTLICDDQNESEAYAALILGVDAENATITAKNVTFEINGDSYESYIASKNGKIIVDGTNGEKTAVAYIQYGNYYYAFDNLNDAIAYAKDGETVVLIENVTLTETVVVKNNVTLDLNGYSVIYNVTSTPSQNTYAILNDGTLTIKDTSEEANGQICLVYEGANVGYTISTICNRGTLNVVSGTVNAESGVQNISYAIDNNNTVSNAIINVSGGYVVGGASGYSIRLYANSAKYENALNVTGGEVWYVWAQAPNTSAHKLSIDVSGGYVYYVCVYSYVGVIDCTSYEISLDSSCMEYEPYASALKEGYVLKNVNGVYTLVEEKTVSLEEIFKDKGYSTSPDGITRGYTVDHELLAIYMEQNGLTSFEFGAVFAIEQIDEYAISRAFTGLEKTNSYNVSIKGVTEAYYDLDLVLAIYVKVDGEKKYVNESSEIVTADKILAVTYNSLTKEDEE